MQKVTFSRLAALGIVVTAATVPATEARAQVPGAAPPTQESTRSPLHPRLDGALEVVVRAHAEKGLGAAAETASRLGAEVVDARVRVVVECASGDTTAVKGAVLAAGGRVEGEYGTLLQALVPLNRVVWLADQQVATYVRPPLRGSPDSVVSEGVGPSGASAWHVGGPWTGEGIGVAVIDFGFAGRDEAKASGDLPASVRVIDFTAGKLDSTVHGTAVAEIVHDMAPGAVLYLVCVDTEVSLGQAKEWAVAQGISVINHSASWYSSGRGDGSGGPETPSGIVADAVAKGIVWVNSAGNLAQKHWSGTFVPAGSDPYWQQWHLWAPGDLGNTLSVATLAAYDSVHVSLKWDEWATVSTDFDLFLVDAGDAVTCSNGVGAAPCPVLAQSARIHPAGSTPTEYLEWRNETGSERAVSVFVRRSSGSGTPRLDLWVANFHDIQHQVGVGSVTEPGSSPAALTVGAACWQTGVLEAGSGQGPTIDGRIKPDLAGPGVVSTNTYGAASGCTKGFSGSSAATPHVAGAAALVREANPTASPADVKAWLMANAIDRGATGADNQYGSGTLALPASPDPETVADLWLGEPLVGVSLERPSAFRLFRLRIPASYFEPPDRFYVTVSIRDGSGDADLYVRSGAPPTLSAYDFRSERVGNTDRLERILVGPEPVYIGLHSWVPYGGVTLRADTNPTLSPVAQPFMIGGSTWLTGMGFTPGSVVKFFVSTAAGVVTFGPYVPVERSSTALRLDLPADVHGGNGYGSALVVNTDQGYETSNAEGQLIVGNWTWGIPTITSINGVPLSPPSPDVPLANVSTVVLPGSTVTIGGTGLQYAKVNFFTASGNLGPLTPLAGATETEIRVVLPPDVPVGPGSFQAVRYYHPANAVSVPVGEAVTVTGVSVSGSTVTVDGTGFCPLTVVKLYNLQGSVVADLGGLNPDGTAKIPVTVVSSHQLTFEKPAAALAGPAFVGVINPPFIPFSSSGNDPDGAFTMP